MADENEGSTVKERNVNPSTPTLPDVNPPNYESVKDPPPTYDSLFGEIRQARQESSNILDFFKKILLLFLSTIGCTIFLAILLVIPISSIVLGAKYKDDCPIQSKIPIYLIVLGSFGILRNIVGLFNQIKIRCSEEEEDIDPKKSTCAGIIDLCLVAWFIAGNVWVYGNYEPNYVDPTSPLYCHKTLYLFAFGLTTASYVFVGLVCCCMCCVACCSLLVN